MQEENLGTQAGVHLISDLVIIYRFHCNLVSISMSSRTHELVHLPLEI